MVHADDLPQKIPCKTISPLKLQGNLRGKSHGPSERFLGGTAPGWLEPSPAALPSALMAQRRCLFAPHASRGRAGQQATPQRDGGEEGGQLRLCPDPAVGCQEGGGRRQGPRDTGHCGAGGRALRRPWPCPGPGRARAQPPAAPIGRRAPPRPLPRPRGSRPTRARDWLRGPPIRPLAPPLEREGKHRGTRPSTRWRRWRAAKSQAGLLPPPLGPLFPSPRYILVSGYERRGRDSREAAGKMAAASAPYAKYPPPPPLRPPGGKGKRVGFKPPPPPAQTPSSLSASASRARHLRDRRPPGQRTALTGTGPAPTSGGPHPSTAAPR